MNINVEKLEIDKTYSIDSYPNTGIFLVNNDVMFANKETKEIIYLGQKEDFKSVNDIEVEYERIE